ncbi:MAG: hypothetical protein L3J37_00280 [Rhodobacteraceae bacterium]|nr:hypothetical protein [Paracoccaceae bacterium]
MSKLNLAAVLFAATFLGACIETTAVSTSPMGVSSGLQQTAVAALTKDFRDPESVRVRNVRGFATPYGDTIVCGEVNGKNAFGAYVGYRGFYIRMRNGVVKSTKVDDGEYLNLGTVACTQAANGQLALPSTDVPS